MKVWEIAHVNMLALLRPPCPLVGRMNNIISNVPQEERRALLG